jgi:hypothetical protein
VLDKEPVLLLHAGAFPADDHPVVDRRRLLLGEIRRDDQQGRNASGLLGAYLR